MNKLYLTLIFGILLMSVITAGVTLSNISLTSKAEATLKAELPIDKVKAINPTITDITCDKTICKSWVSYPNLINTEWINSKSYTNCVDNIIREDKEVCTTPDKIEGELEETKEVCKIEVIETNVPICSSVDYTQLELESMRSLWIKDRLESFAGYLEDRKIK
jgi:hypothetical protein